LVLLLSLAGCGAAATPTASVPTESAPVAGAAAPAENAPVANAAATGGERLIKHAMGETAVPAQPQRVIVLDNGSLDNTLALGVQPIGAATVADAGFLPYLKTQTANIQTVGTIDQPNLETISVLKPDLILGSKDVHEEIYAQLSEIAPTVLVEKLGETWKANLHVQAEALGKTEQATQLMATYNQRLDTFKQQMGDKLATTNVSVIRSMPDHLRIYMNSSFVGSILKDAGLPRPEAQNQDKVMEKITTEQIPQLDGSIIFFTQRDPAASQLTEAMKHPLWANLNAVKAGNVYEVPHDVWINGLGIQAVNLVLDDLTSHLVR
jgi:iron complex transport system substrate-binding protein